MILSVIMLISVALMCYLFNLNNRFARIIVIYFVSICAIMLTGSLYASKTAYYPRGFEYQIFYFFYSMKIPLTTVVRSYYLSFALYILCGAIFIRNLTKPRKLSFLWFLPVIFFPISNDPAVSKWLYLMSYTSPSNAVTAARITGIMHGINYVIIYLYMILPLLLLVRYCIKTQIYVKRRDAIVLGACVTSISLFVQVMIMNGIYKNIMFDKVNAAKIAESMTEGNEYVFMPVIIGVIAIAILLLLMYFKPFKYFSAAGIREVRYKQKSLQESRALLHIYKNALLGMRQQLQFATENLENQNYTETGENVALARQIAEESYASLSKTLMQTGNPKIVLKKICLNNHIDEAVKKCKGEYPINITAADNAKNITVYADGGHITEVFTNLLVNAMDALKVKKGENPHIDIEITKDDTLAYIEIRDNGVGIERKNIKKIFRPFFTTKSASYGGVGLNYAENIIKQHNGDIRVRSVYGEYTVFQITLPVYAGKSRGVTKNEQK